MVRPSEVSALPVDRVPDQMKGLKLRNDRADDRQSRSLGRRNGIKPDADCGDRRAEPGEAVDQAASERAQNDNENLLRRHGNARWSGQVLTVIA